jgi:hypothetical protein
MIPTAPIVCGPSIDKLLQLAGAFLRAAGGTMEYTKLLKLMYLLERQGILDTGEYICGDIFYPLPLGPVPQYLLNCIRGDADNPNWDAHFEVDRYDVRLKDNPGDQLLSAYEDDLVAALTQEHQHRNYWAMIQFTHRLPEWKTLSQRPTFSAITIPDILLAEGYTPEEAMETEAFAREMDEDRQAFFKAYAETQIKTV